MRIIGLLLIVLFVFWFDRHNLHFAEVLFSQIKPAQILEYISVVIHKLAQSLN